MDVSAAAGLIAGAIPKKAGFWADIGAGSGTFTLALASLLPLGSRLVAIDKDAEALAALEANVRRGPLGIPVEPRVADLRLPLQLEELDGVLLANTLHFIPAAQQPATLERIARLLRSESGRLVLVDYDGRDNSEWVPFPVSWDRFVELSNQLGWPTPTEVGRRPSRFGGSIYAAFVDPAT